MSEANDSIEARRRRLVGTVLTTGPPSECIETTFSRRFGRHFHEPAFWDAFEDACRAVNEGKPWYQARQLLLSFSWPQEINAKDEWGETMLSLATTFGRANVVNVLCQIKADTRIENAKGWSVIHIAAAYNHVKILQVFLTLGISVDSPGSRLGYTPLHLAVAMDHIEAVQCLHASGKVNFMRTAGNGYTALHVAVEHNAERCMAFLIQQYPDLKFQHDRVLDENPAHKAARGLQPHSYKGLAKHGARIDLENIEGSSAFDLAIDNDRYSY
ncbi:hypothetical protein Poli38472_012089 [Pythium oligandrum]|uniref:Ankyrin repeat protein n=1 Tax=Pythium oligandrum TaxID=41045 RepID=A0A8K1FQW1_PYTOL|nr:hypothetical protein Poli38472_012089 [Pythium oligandrum]|eukprot:TMW66973.1 hypothetical protein Poli38472_012089 [Pythium oligandrum]